MRLPPNSLYQCWISCWVIESVTKPKAIDKPQQFKRIDLARVVPLGAFHYVKDSRNFGPGSQMERSLSVPSDREYSWPPLVPNIPTEICCSILTNRFIFPTSVHLCREFGKGIKNGKSHSSLIGKCCSISSGIPASCSPHSPRALETPTNLRC